MSLDGKINNFRGPYRGAPKAVGRCTEGFSRGTPKARGVLGGPLWGPPRNIFVGVFGAT